MRWGTLLSLALTLCLSLSAMAQQRGKTLTNEDFPSGRRVDTETKEKADAEKEKKADEKAEKDSGEKGEKAKSEKPEEKAEKEKREKEAAWQKKQAETQRKLSGLDRQKTEAELTAQQLREQLRRGGTDPQEYEAIKNQLSATEQRLRDLKGEYDDMKKAAEDVQKEGTDKGFKEREIPKQKDGRPNSEYYTKRYKDLSEKQQLDQQKLQLYQTRLNEARQRTYQSRPSDPSRVGNAYYTDPDVKKQIEEAQAEMLKIQEDLDKTNQELEHLQREAKSSGVGIK